YVLKILQDAFAKGDGNAEDSPMVLGLMQCRRSAVSAGGLDLSGCSPIQSSLNGRPATNYAWLQARLSASLSMHGDFQQYADTEHLQILLQAAKLAGLASSPLFKYPFWARYPTR